MHAVSWLSAAILSLSAIPAWALEGSWRSGPPMPTPRAEHQALMLSDGSLLVVGGVGAAAAPASSVLKLGAALTSWSPVRDLGRSDVRACVLRDGRVLVTGGITTGVKVAACDLYDPLSGSWRAVASLHLPRAYHICEALPDGGAVVIGGRTDAAGDAAWSTTVERFDPVANTWTVLDPSVTAGGQGAALRDGVVIALGGTSAQSSGSDIIGGLRFDPADGRSRALPDMSPPVAAFTLTALLDGRALRAGGRVFGAPDPAESAAEIYDPVVDTWMPTSAMAEARAGHAAVLLADGRVLVAGGFTSASAEVWSPATSAWTSAPGMPSERQDFTLSRVAGNRIVAVGGYAFGDATVSTAIFTPLGIATTIASSIPAVTNAATIPVTIHFSRAVSGFSLDDLAVTNGSVSNLTGGGADYACTLAPAGDGAVVVTVADGAAADGDGHATLGASLSRTVDTVAPEIAIGMPIVVDQGTARWTVDFSDAAAVMLTLDQVEVIATGTATGTASVSGSGTSTRTVTVTSMDGDGTIAVRILPGSARDAAGNVSGASASSTAVAVHPGASPVIITPPLANASTSGSGSGGGCGMGSGLTVIAAALTALGGAARSRFSPTSRARSG
ncbi:MAG: hypothetical protein H0W83_01045 [Planctomycetes bacterium]|nr:hypothetical protein [Planctomycetota bacterium]